MRNFIPPDPYVLIVYIDLGEAVTPNSAIIANQPTGSTIIAKQIRRFV
jgi:hypothetical protein